MEIKLGRIINGPANKDAIHIAVAPVVAGHDIRPGQAIGILTDDKVTCDVDPCIGIADPFLTETIKTGQRFYMFLYPNTVTGMRHEWEHPAFISKEANATSVAFLMEHAESINKTYSQLIDDMKEYVRTGNSVFNGDDDSYNDVRWEHAWTHFTEVTGIPTDNEWAPYRCAC